MKKTGKALIGVLSVAALVGTGVATWTINGGITTETTGPIDPIIAEVGTRDIAIAVTGSETAIRFDEPTLQDLEVTYNVKASAAEGAADGFNPYGYDFSKIAPEYQPNLIVTTQVLRDNAEVTEDDAFFKYVEVPTKEIAYTDWLDEKYDDPEGDGYLVELEFKWSSEKPLEGQNPQVYADKLSDPDLQEEFFTELTTALKGVQFKFTFTVGGASETPVETPDTGEITIPKVDGSTLTIDGMTGTTVEAGTHRITITTEEGKEVTDKKLTVIENGIKRPDVTLTRASGHTYYVDYEFKADTTYSFEYTLKDEEVPTLYTVTYTKPENGTITLKNGDTDVADGAQVEENTNLTLTVTANDGYEITSILVNDEELNTEKTYESPYTTSLAINEATTIKAIIESVGEDLSKPIKATIADVIADQTFDQTHLYEVTGTITELGTRIDYGRFTISDGEGNELEIYGSRIENEENPSLYYENEKWDYNFNKGDDPTPAIAVGNEITMHVFGKKSNNYNNYYGVILDYHTPVIAPKSIEITNGESAEVTEGNSIQLNVSTNPEFITVPLTWTTENEEIANVDQNGLVTGVSKGSTNITVSYGDVKDTILITVNKKSEQEIITLGTFNLVQEDQGKAVAATNETLLQLLSESLTSEYFTLDETETKIIGCCEKEFYLDKGQGGPDAFGPRFGKDHEHTITLKLKANSGTIKVTEVVIRFASWGTSEGEIKVNESAYQITANKAIEDKTYSINGTDTLNITSNKRTVLQTITIKGYIEQ